MQANQAQALFEVSADEAAKFANVWTYHGLSVPIGEQHLTFATDFANVVLKSFIEECQRSARNGPKRIATLPGTEIEGLR